MPELVWKSFIDFEIEQEQFDNARKLYERLLERTSHVKVWISYAQFEGSIDRLEAARAVFSKGFEALKNAESKEEVLSYGSLHFGSTFVSTLRLVLCFLFFSTAARHAS